MEVLCPGVSSFSSSDEWVYCGSVTLTVTESLNAAQVDATNRPEGSLQIGETTGTSTGKVDSITGESLSGTEFKIYAVLETTGADGVSSGWVSGGANDGSLKQYVSYSSASTYTSGETISRLRYGTYYIYETKAPNDNYDLRDQDNYHVTSDSNGQAQGYQDFGANEEWVYIGQVTINFSVVKSVSAGYTLDNPYATTTVTNKPKAQLQIEKVDQEYSILKLEGAEIVIYADLSSAYITDGWVTGEKDGVKTYATSPSSATTYTTDADGLIYLTKLNYGTYYIYETKTPEGYDITKQDGYLDKSAGSWTSSLSGDWAYLGSINVPEGSTATGIAQGKILPFEFTGTNIKKVNELEGFVWVDMPDTKGNTANYLYKENDADQNDYELGDIEVRLYLQNGNGSYYKAATTYTGSNGTYTFSFDPDASNYCGIEVTYWQLVTAYVEFVYDNTEYVVVDPFVTATDGMDITINSKAQEVEMELEELEDENLTGTAENYPGLAVTYQGGTLGNATLEKLNEILNNTSTVVNGESTTQILETTPLTGYYEKDTSDANHYKVSNINLGVLEKVDPTYSVEETLSYAYITINGFTYIYYYDTPTDATVYDSYDDVPDVVKQQDAHSYEYANQVSVYSSDIASTNAKESDMQLYLVYSIYVYNSETYQEDDLYCEQKLYLSSLTDTYDTERLTLSTDNYNNSQYTGSDQFGMWSGSSGTASYSLFDGSAANDNSVYKNGINPGQTIKTYIQFKVTSTSLTEILQGDLSRNKSEATTVNATGFHEYLRTDNLWSDATSEKKYNADTVKYPRDVTYATYNSSGEVYYLHKSEEKEETSGALYVAIITTNDTPPDSPPDEEEPVGERTISGTVYEDASEKSTYTYNNIDYTTYVGNGKIDETETNRATNVKVELLKAVAEDTNEDGTIDLNDLGDTNGDGTIDLNDLKQATLYVQNTSNSTGYDANLAETTTDEKGDYSFEGVIPGYYYIRFTYGDGTQKIGYTDNDGNFVEVDSLTSVDYKSTIINTDEAKSILENAIEESWTNYDTITLQTATESALQSYYAEGTTNETAMMLLEWYKYLDSAIAFSTATDDLNTKDQYNGYEYTEKGIYDASGTLIAKYYYNDNGQIDYIYEVQYIDDGSGSMVEDETDKTKKIAEFNYNANGEIESVEYTGASTVYPLNIQSYTPETAISVENTGVMYTYDEDTHTNVYDKFDLGVVKQSETDTEITKKVENIAVSVQQGSTVISGTDSKYVSVFDNYVGLELDPSIIYGSDLEVTYQLVVKNSSEEDYIEKDEDEYGTYYKYGRITTSTKAKTIQIGEVIDDVDSKYTVQKLVKEKKEVEQILTSGENSTILDENVIINKLESNDTTIGENSTTTTSSITLTGWGEISTGETLTVEYTVDSLLNSDEDTLYENYARITSITLSQLTTLTSIYEWGERAYSDISVYPATGGDMSNVLYVAGAISLIAVAFGIILIRKKII